MRMFTALVVALASSLVSVAALASDVTFVSSDDELNAALEAASQGTIRNVAVKQEFYVGSAKQTKDRIRGLIATTIELGDRIVYMYAQEYEDRLTKDLLGVSASGCTPPYMAGKFYRANYPDDPVRICGAMSQKSEDAMRAAIQRNADAVERDFRHRK